MSLHYVENAVAAALCDRDPSTQAAVLGGFMAPAGQDGRPATADSSLGTFLLSSGAGVPTRIPVFRWGTGGRVGAETWPCITFRVIGMRDDTSDRWRPSAAVVRRLVGPDKTVDTSIGTSASGKKLVADRPYPQPSIVSVDIGAHALDQTEAGRIMEAVRALFPIRCALPYVDRQGTTGTYRMERTSIAMISASDNHQLDVTDGNGYTWVLAYDIWAWIDNALDETLKRTIDNEPELTVDSL